MNRLLFLHNVRNTSFQSSSFRAGIELHLLKLDKSKVNCARFLQSASIAQTLNSFLKDDIHPMTQFAMKSLNIESSNLVREKQCNDDVNFVMASFS